MKRALSIFLSGAAAFALLLLLVRLGKVDLGVTLKLLRSVTVHSFAKIVTLNAILIYLSTKKWRSIDKAWRQPSDTIPSPVVSYAVTSVGLAMGVLLPVQIAMSAARTFATYAHGAAIKRGTAGTLIEQGFDIYIAAFLGAASAVTWFSHGGAMTWALCSSAAILLALFAVGPSLRMVRHLAEACPNSSVKPLNRILEGISKSSRSGVLDVSLGLRLVVLSALRFGAVVLICVQTAEAVGLVIPSWQMAAALPFIIFATVIGLTPGGIGLNELAGTGALKMFGTPVSLGAQWALANRVLVAESYFFMAACAVAFLGFRIISIPRFRRSVVGSSG